MDARGMPGDGGASQPRDARRIQRALLAVRLRLPTAPYKQSAIARAAAQNIRRYASRSHHDELFVAARQPSLQALRLRTLLHVFD